MTKVGVIGVGTMGEPMAANLLKAGHEVWCTDPNPEPVARLCAAGATSAATPAELAAQVDVIVSSLPNDAIVEAVVLGPDGVAASGQPGLILVDTSTISPATAQRLASALEAKGMHMLDAPVSGGQTGAIAGTLAIMVGGSRAAYDEALPVMEAIGKNISYVGDHGAALVVKLCNNLIIGAIMIATSEALTMAAKTGLDTGLVNDVLSNATARGWIIQEYVPNFILAGNTTPGFKLSLERKDVGLALDYGKELGVPMFMSALVHQLYTQAYGLGKGDLDFSAISQLYSQATDVSLTRRSDAKST